MFTGTKAFREEDMLTAILQQTREGLFIGYMIKWLWKRKNIDKSIGIIVFSDY